jgi:hypothetical protein
VATIWRSALAADQTEAEIAAFAAKIAALPAMTRRPPLGPADLIEGPQETWIRQKAEVSDG